MISTLPAGYVHRISGPTILARGLEKVKLYNRIYVGHLGLLGEVVRIHPDHCMIQVYEETSGLSVGEPVVDAGEPLMAELGPGLLSMIFDGIQRPLQKAAHTLGAFMELGFRADPLPRDKKWTFLPRVRPGDRVRGGDLLGIVPAEECGLEHRVLVPPGVEGEVTEVREGRFALEDPVIDLKDRTPLFLYQRWPVRSPRPVEKKLPLDQLFITGQRIIDTLFPLSVGGSVILPGGFGTGKTVLEQSLAKYAKADVVIYVGCGERGNEITDVLEEFPLLTDPYTRQSLMKRTILIVNTSNMPVAAREASIYTGITMAEYYRDMGYKVAVMADSTSRWAEALREISSRMEEMPGEEGYPTSLGSRLAQFYERAGRVSCLGSDDREGAVTLCAAVSPPGGDFSEPVTQSSVRVTGAMWALDARLARQRHYPAIHWGKSFSLYTERLETWFQTHVASDWPSLRHRVFELLQREEEIQGVVQLVGPDALQDTEKMILESARILREYYLRQNAYSPADAFCTIEKQYWILKVFFHIYDELNSRLKEGAPLPQLPMLDFGKQIESLRETPPEDMIERSRFLLEQR